MLSLLAQDPAGFFLRIVCASLGMLILLVNFCISSLRLRKVPSGYFDQNCTDLWVRSGRICHSGSVFVRS